MTDSKSTDHVRIVEVGLRDGLQNEPQPVAAAVRADWFNALADAGLRSIEAGSYVSPKWVPQMADTEQVIAAIKPSAGLDINVLVPNLKGLEAALQHPCDTIAVFTAASESFTRRNINCSIQESLDRFAPMIQQAKAAGKRVRGYMSCVVGCPYEGKIEPHAVAHWSSRLFQLGVDEVSLGDTIGVARPREIHQLLDALLAVIPARQLALHCHDTYGQALANVMAGLARGLRTFDAAVAGLGGCPYASGATGNLATEDLLYLLAGEGFNTGVDLPQVAAVGRNICQQLGRSNASRVARAFITQSAQE